MRSTLRRLFSCVPTHLALPSRAALSGRVRPVVADPAPGAHPRLPLAARPLWR
jgi:hypothetical protein